MCSILLSKNGLCDTYPTKHAFISHDTNGKVVNGASVVLSAHNFRSHVAWSS